MLKIWDIDKAVEGLARVRRVTGEPPDIMICFATTSIQLRHILWSGKFFLKENNQWTCTNPVANVNKYINTM